MARNYPLPENIRPKQRWEIRESAAARIEIGRKARASLYVPTTSETRAMYARRHEMLHARYTPDTLLNRAKRAGLRSEFVQAAEDIRVGMLGDRIGLPMDVDLSPIERQAIPKIQPDNIGALCALSSIVTSRDQWTRLREAVKGSPIEEAITAMAHCTNAIMYRSRCRLTAKDTLALAAAWQALFQEPAAKHGTEEPEDRGVGLFQWGRMDTVTMPLVERQRGMLSLRPSLDTGGFVAPDRLYLDGRVLGAVTRRQGLFGGTILIDASGSMDEHCNMDAIRAALEILPASTIATYSGQGFRGSLRILAHGGKRAVADGEWNGCDNLVDGPALQWLARQPGPRIWLSDGAATVVSGSATAARAWCKAFAGLHGIRQVYTMQGAIEAAKGVLK